jgi:hypothetical protein
VAEFDQELAEAIAENTRRYVQVCWLIICCEPGSGRIGINLLAIVDPDLTGFGTLIWFRNSHSATLTNLLLFIFVGSVGTFTTFFKDKTQRSHKTVEIKGFLTIFA